jgi:hypothetical protein
LGFEDKGTFVILTNGFKKKDQKVPKSKITLAEQRKNSDTEFAKNFENGYQEFKIGKMLKLARKETGLTQEDVAKDTTSLKR